MTEHKAAIQWARSGPDFLKGRYSREHTQGFIANSVKTAIRVEGRAE